MQGMITENSQRKLCPQVKPYEMLDRQLRGFLLRVQPSGYKSYYYSYVNNFGKRARISIGSTENISAKQARDRALLHRASLENVLEYKDSSRGTSDPALVGHTPSLEAFINTRYADWAMASLAHGQKTNALIRRNFECLFTLPLNEISIALIKQWRQQRLARNIKPSTINRDISALRALLSKALQWQLLDHHPLADLKPLKTNSTPRRRYLKQIECRRLVTALLARDDRLKHARERGNAIRRRQHRALLPSLVGQAYADRLSPMVLLSLKTGIHRQELFDLKWQDIHYSQALMEVHPHRKKTRVLPLSPTAQKVLRQWRRQNLSAQTEDFVFPSSKGGKLNNVKRSWCSLLKTANIRDFRWQDLRHDFAAKLIHQGTALATVAALCGHSSLTTTLRYLPVDNVDQRQAISLLG